jgi:predicted metal-binding membrane protein
MSRVGVVAGRWPRHLSRRASRRALAAVLVLLFAGGSALTVGWGTPMSHMGVMPMHGGSAMSMASVGMSGPPWSGGAASFVAMWTVMMVAMMLPSLAPTLWRYHRALDGMGVPHPGRQTALVGMGYFAVWSAIGVAVFPLGAALAAAGMRLPALARAVPLTVGVVVLGAGATQLTAWKAHHLARCREASVPSRAMPADAATAWLHGLRLGVHCSQSCAGLTATVLAVGIMDLRAMALVTAAITAERLTSAGARVARAIGAVAVGAGLLLTARAAGVI